MTLKDKLEDLRMQQAADWLQQLREGNREANAEFIQWVSESPANLKAFLTMDALSQATRGELRKVPPEERLALLSSVIPKVVDLIGTQASCPQAPSARLRPRGNKRLVWGLAASVGILALVALWQLAFKPFEARYVTAPTQQRTLNLPDGSTLYLNARSEVAVRLDDRERSIRLMRGEALFDVARDTRRPFRVHTRDAVVEAIGTQFNINARADGTHIAVVEGKVKISRSTATTIELDGTRAPESGEEEIASLAAGDSVQISRAGQIERRQGIDVRKAIAWSQPELLFNGTSLEEAARQFNRHRRATPIRLVDVELGSHHYTGVFNATDAESFAALLELEPDLVIERRADEIVIRGRK